VTEDVASDVTGISFSDVDAGAGTVTVTLAVTAGALTSTSGAGVTVAGSGSGKVTLTGTIGDINSFIASGAVDFTSPFNDTSLQTLTASINDGGNTGAGGAKSDSDTVTLNVTAVNDAPQVAVSGGITVTEDVPSDITGITFSDVDAGSASVTVTLSVSAGTLTAASGGGVAVLGSGTGTMTLTGSIADINSFIAIGNVDFTTALNNTTAQSLTATIDDGGNTGSGGAKTDSDSVTLTVTPANDAPTDLALSNSKVDENAIGVAIGTLTVTDPDTGDTHTLTVNDTRFEIVGNQLQLKAGESLDFETEPSVTVQVTAKDAGGLTYAENFVITVNDKTGSSIGGGGGPDSLDGTAEDDAISGFAGNDTLNGLAGGDTLDGGADNDSLDGGTGNDSLVGGTGNDSLVGGTGNDSLNGGADTDNLDGGAGNDTLDGGAGSDAIVGGDGNDRIFWDPADSAIDGGNGNDTLFLNGSDIDLALAPVASIEAIDMTGGGNNTITLSALDVIGLNLLGTITIIGDSGDTVVGGGGWTPAGTDINGNNLFTQSGATLVIDPDVVLV